jgi:uncharacterized BrkB/YihY/UPF0761 family membrane protein
LLVFFVLALGVLLGAEFNAAIQERVPAKVKPPRVLDPRSWQTFNPEDEEQPSGPASNGPASKETPAVTADETKRQSRKLS